MTTEALRKVITVRNWVLTHKGLSVSYERTDAMPYKEFHWILSPEGTLRALYTQSCIDFYSLVDDEWIVEMNGASYTWDNFAANYRTCQWEALQIAINHEASKELDKDMNMLELDAAINALK